MRLFRRAGVIVWVVADATIDGSETGTSFRHALGFMDRGLKLHDTMIFERKLPRYIKNEPRYANSFEYMFVLSKGYSSTFNAIKDSPNIHAGTTAYRSSQVREVSGRRAQSNSNYGKPLEVESFSKRSSIWRYSTGNGHSAPDNPMASLHPAIFPLSLATDHIRTWTNPGDLVIDPMAGSGTALKAAKELGRKAIGIEINEPYLDIIKRRLAQDVLPLASLA